MPKPPASTAAGGEAAAPASPALFLRLKEDMKVAMKAKDQARLDCIRFLNAAIKSREIELREKKKVLDDAEVIQVLQKMSKQRRDSIESYTSGGRDDLVGKEQAELAVIEGYLPKPISREELEKIVDEVIAELGATSVKGMGAVLKAVTARTGGAAESRAINEITKTRLK